MISNKKNSNLIKDKVFHYLVVFVSLTIMATSLVISGYFYNRRYNIELNSFKENQTQKLSYFLSLIDREESVILSDLYYISESLELQNYLLNDTDENKQHLNRSFELLSQTRTTYDQIRFLDLEGIEVVRVNNLANKAVIIPEEKLQDKSDRYYFKDTVVLNEGEVYLSQLDLNIENGEVEEPYKPVTRYGIPVYLENEKKGILLINYLSDNSLSLLNDYSTQDEEKLLYANSEGYWLKGPDLNSEWGFMFEDRKSLTLENWNEGLWNDINNDHSDSFYYSDDGFYTFLVHKKFSNEKANKISAINDKTMVNDDQDNKLLISFVPNALLHRESAILARALIGMNIFTFFLLSFFLIVVLKGLNQRIKNKTKILKLNETLRIITKVLRHDLSNAFTHVNFALELFKESPKEKKLLTEISRSVALGLEIISQMRELETMISSGKNLVPTRIDSVLNKVQEKYNVVINLNKDVTIKADAALESVFNNIISNAINHGKVDKIDVVVSNKNNKTLIKFIDEGPGIPDKIKQEIFKEGYKYGDTGNTGLGLYIVEQIINRYGGKVWVEDNKPKGAIFVIELK